MNPSPELPESTQIDLKLEQMLRQMSDEERAEFRKEMLAQAVRSEDSPRSYAAFYELLHGHKPPKHVMSEIEVIYRAHERGTGALVFAWRGSWKTTSICETFVAYRIGKEPGKTHMIIGANDDTPEKVTKNIAGKIEGHPEWKRVFPNVVPDYKMGWAVGGYWVKDVSIPPDQWIAQQSTVTDPTFVGGGWESGRLIGKHPTGLLIIDDIHDTKNSSSSADREAIIKVVLKTIMYAAVRDEDKLETWLVAVGTPWLEDDAYHTLKNSGQFEFISIPAMRAAQEGEGTYIDGVNLDGRVFDDIVGWWHLESPETYGVRNVIAARALCKVDFWQMVMMDIQKAKISGLKYYSYPHEKIDMRWPMCGGVDLATVMEKRPNPGRDFFSMAYGIKTPLNQLVIFDGILEQCTQAQAEEHMKKPQYNYTNWKRSILEGDGIGEQFYVNLIRRNPGLRVEMRKTGGKAKRYRQERELAPWLENGIIMISDANTPYLSALRKALDDFPDGNNDIRDGLYWCAYGFPEVLTIQDRTQEGSLPFPMQIEKKKNPYAGLSNYYSWRRR